MIFVMRKFLRKRKPLVLEMTRRKFLRKRKPSANVTIPRKQLEKTVFYMARTVNIPVTIALPSNILLRKLKIPGAKRNLRKKRSSISC